MAEVPQTDTAMADVLQTDTAMLLSIPDVAAAASIASGFVRRSDRVRKAPERFITTDSVAAVRKPVVGLETKVVPREASISRKNATVARRAPSLKRKATDSKPSALAKRRHISKEPLEKDIIARNNIIPLEGVDANGEAITQETSAQHILGISDTTPSEMADTRATFMPDTKPSEIPDIGLTEMPNPGISMIIDTEAVNVPDFRAVELPDADAPDMDIHELDDPCDEDFVPGPNDGAPDEFDQITMPVLQRQALVNTSVNTLPAKKRSPRKKSTALLEANVKTKPVPPILVEPRPEPFGSPLVWAEGRQALCETLPYYRAYQSGAHTSNGFAWGFMLGSDDVTRRPFMDDEVVIARAGGHCKTDPTTGQMTQVTNHVSTSASVRSFRNNMNMKVPIILIISQQYRQRPTEVPHQYCVMDYFQVTNVWAEKNNGKLCFMFRFEKIDRTTKSWWMPNDFPSRPNPPAYPTAATRNSCVSCGASSIQIFQSWMCLNEKCKDFWTMDGVSAPDELSYNPQFLEERNPWPQNVRPPFDIVPRLPQSNSGSVVSDAYSRLCWKGIVCQRCGRCTSRRHWDAWRCETAGCGYVYQLAQPVLSPRAVLDGHEVEYTGHAAPLDIIAPPVTLKAVKFLGEWRVHKYELCPGNIIVHFHANEAVNSVPNGAHDLFEALQKDNCMGLERFPMKNKIGRGEFLAQHFAVNYGMPYKYVVAVDSKSFADAPVGILSAMQRLGWAAKSTVPHGTLKAFNEVLAVGYFESNKMGFHDDGEKELGPTIATLSLGGRATMDLKMKDRYYKGFTKRNTYNPHEPVLPGCALEEDRKILNAKWGKVSKQEFDTGVAQLRKRMGGKNSPIFLDMTLCHGDIVIMHGAEMQKYYEHRVTPSGKLRFALTSRHVKPEMVDEADHWKGVYDPPVELNYDGTVTDAVTAPA